MFRFVVFAEEGGGEFPADGGESEAEDDQDAGGSGLVLGPAEATQEGEGGGPGSGQSAGDGASRDGDMFDPVDQGGGLNDPVEDRA